VDGHAKWLSEQTVRDKWQLFTIGAD